VKCWYTLYTKPNAEAQVARTLNARGFETFLPLLPPRQNQHAQPLFPTYLFLYCDLAQVDVGALRWIPGLRRILCFGGRLAAVPEDAIQLMQEGLREIEAEGGLPLHRFKPGDAVVIDSGPLAGLRGIFQGPVGPTERVQILIRFLGEANKTEISVEDLRADSDNDEVIQQRRGTRGRGRHIRYRD
jgi:transcriptional antiterminator RfaH